MDDTSGDDSNQSHGFGRALDQELRSLEIENRLPTTAINGTIGDSSMASISDVHNNNNNSSDMSGLTSNDVDIFDLDLDFETEFEPLLNVFASKELQEMEEAFKELMAQCPPLSPEPPMTIDIDSSSRPIDDFVPNHDSEVSRIQADDESGQDLLSVIMSETIFRGAEAQPQMKPLQPVVESEPSMVVPQPLTSGVTRNRTGRPRGRPSLRAVWGLTDEQMLARRRAQNAESQQRSRAKRQMRNRGLDVNNNPTITGSTVVPTRRVTTRETLQSVDINNDLFSLEVVSSEVIEVSQPSEAPVRKYFISEAQRTAFSTMVDYCCRHRDQSELIEPHLQWLKTVVDQMPVVSVDQS